MDRIRLFLHSREIAFRVKYATGEYKPELDANKARDGASPNFVHACDAAHLMLTVNAAVSEGISSIATVHDSFGCLASQAERFRKIIREQFAQMYLDHDVLDAIYQQAQNDLSDPNNKWMREAHELRPKPDGGLDLNQVLDAQYAFA
jgi:DNA-directed RNA polymerase